MLRTWRHLLRGTAAAAAAAGGLGIALVTVQAAGAAGNAPPGITGGQTLTSGSTLASSDGHYQAIFANGQLSVSITGGRQLWSKGTAGSGDYAVLQPNGDLVIFGPGGQVEWDSGVTGSGCPALDLQLNGDFVVYDTSGIWYANTAQHGMQPGDVLEPGWSLYPVGSKYQLTMKTNGNLELINDSNKEIWSSATSGAGAYAEMETNGDFEVVSSAGKSLWSSKTSGNSGATLALDSSGDIEVDSTAGKALWTSGSTGDGGTGSAFSLAPISASTTPCAASPTTTATTTTVVQTVTQTQTQTVTVPTTTVVTVTAPPLIHKRRVDVKLVLNFTFSGQVTTLRSLTIGRLPKGAQLTATYDPHLRGLRVRRLHAVRGRTMVTLIRYLKLLRYLPGQTLNVDITRTGYENEWGTFTFRSGRLPAYRTR